MNLGRRKKLRSPKWSAKIWEGEGADVKRVRRQAGELLPRTLVSPLQHSVLQSPQHTD